MQMDVTVPEAETSRAAQSVVARPAMVSETARDENVQRLSTEVPGPPGSRFATVHTEQAGAQRVRRLRTPR